MSAFLFMTNRMNMSYGDIMDITKAEKRLHTFKVLCEWPSAREQLKLENMYNPKLVIYLEQKLRINQQFNTLNVYENIGATSGASLVKIWNGMDRWMNFQ